MGGFSSVSNRKSFGYNKVDAHDVTQSAGPSLSAASLRGCQDAFQASPRPPSDGGSDHAAPQGSWLGRCCAALAARMGSLCRGRVSDVVSDPSWSSSGASMSRESPGSSKSSSSWGTVSIGSLCCASPSSRLPTPPPEVRDDPKERRDAPKERRDAPRNSAAEGHRLRQELIAKLKAQSEAGVFSGFTWF